MQSSTSTSTGNLSLVEPNQVHGSIGPAAPETLGHRVLELSNILQTTLDLEHQVALFYKAMQQHLEIDGLVYTHPDTAARYELGDDATQRATYDLKLQQESLGSLRFFRELPFTNRELKLMENLLCGLVYPLRNALSYLAAIRLASHDPLTGVQNRRALDLAMQREVELAHRQQAPMSLLVIDADHFKLFNDQYGHSFGDDVLRALASTTATTIRRCDLLFRFGGEEFVVIASHTKQDGATLLAERIRQAVENITTINGRETSLTVSIGVTELTETDTAESLFERCDDAMYQAKQNGRNRVVVG